MASPSQLREQLILRALAALCEIADECGKKPAPKSLSLRFLLAYTFVMAGADPKWKWLWDKFWEHTTAPLNPMKPMDDYLRGSGAMTALNGICRQVGYEPNVDLFKMLRNHRKVRRRPEVEPALDLSHANDEPVDDDAA